MGEAARQSGIPRNEVFLTTKIMSAGGSAEKTYKKCLDSVQKIDGENGYVDLFLIHTPSGGPAAVKEMYQALEKLESEGKARSIGVSNFGVGHIEGMKKYARIWPPHVNQIEVRTLFTPLSLLEGLRRMNPATPCLRPSKLRQPQSSLSNVSAFHHLSLYVSRRPSTTSPFPSTSSMQTLTSCSIQLHPWNQQRTIVEYCNQNGIVIEAYCPLVRNLKAHDQTLVDMSKKHDKTTAQILIRYSLQKGWVSLPKSDTPSRIEANADVYGFSLSDEDMQTLDSLDQGAEGAIVQAVKN